MKSHNVRFWEIRPRKTAKGASWTVRWTVEGREKSVTLARKAQAERHRSRLMQAADRGEAFDLETGLPDSMAREASSVTWYEHACAFADARWPKVAAKGRISLVEGLMAVTPVLVTSQRGAPDRRDTAAGYAPLGVQPAAQKQPDASRHRGRAAMAGPGHRCRCRLSRRPAR